MLDDRFFTIGNIDGIPDEYINKYNMTESSQHNPDKKFPKRVDNVILILSNVLEVESGYSLFKIKGINNCISYGINDENSPRHIEFQKIFVILKNNLPQINVRSRFVNFELDYVLSVKYDEEHPNWNEVFDNVEKSKYIKPWYVKLWNAIPVWDSLI